MEYLATSNSSYVISNNKNLIINKGPIEVSTSTEMDNLCTLDNVGIVYKYIGPTSVKYIHNDYYVVLSD